MAHSTGILGSPRNQRRLLIGSGAVLLAGIAAFVALVVFRGTGNAFTDTYSNKPAQLYHREKTVPVSKEEIDVGREFMRSAVQRQDLPASYNIVHPDLKGAMTRTAWATGNIPVISYPAENVESVHFVRVYSYATSALFTVDLVARPGSGVRPHLEFFLGLKRAEGRKTGRWLVSYWEPNWKPPIPLAPGH